MAVGIDLTVRLVDAIQVAIVIGTVIGAYYRLRGEITVLKHDVGTVKDTFKEAAQTLANAGKELAKALTESAVHETRIASLEEEVRLLRAQRTG